MCKRIARINIYRKIIIIISDTFFKTNSFFKKLCRGIRKFTTFNKKINSSFFFVHKVFKLDIDTKLKIKLFWNKNLCLKLPYLHFFFFFFFEDKPNSFAIREKIQLMLQLQITVITHMHVLKNIILFSFF